MIQAKLAGVQRTVELREIQGVLLSLITDWAKWKDQRSSSSNEMLELVTARLNALAGKVSLVSQAFEQDQRVLRRMIDDHLGSDEAGPDAACFNSGGSPSRTCTRLGAQPG